MRRRNFIASAAGFAAVAGARAGSAPAAVAAPVQTHHEGEAPADAALNQLFDQFFDNDLRLAPESATELGLDVGSRAALKSRLEDVSQAGLENRRRLVASKLAALAKVDRKALSRQNRVSYDTVVYVERANQRVDAFDYVALDGFSPSPYVLSPITGAYQRVPVFLDAKHRIDGVADAEAYLDRMQAFAVAIGANTERFKAAAGSGVLPADFLLDTTLGQLGALLSTPETSGIVASLDRRARSKGLGEQWGLKAADIYAKNIAPALERQIETLKSARNGASHAPGVWRIPQGEAFYAANLQYTTTTDLTAEEIHKIGLDQAKDIAARLDGLLRAQGMTKGTVGARVHALYRDPAQFYPSTPAGKSRLISDLQARLDTVRVRLPQMFSKIPTSGIEVRAVPAAIDAGAPLAYSESPSLDGARPGYVYFNLHDVTEWPKFNLPSTLYHESLPGHQLQGGIALENLGIPLLVRNVYFSGYGEGWALYAEQLADELGLYENDPLGRIGWLKAQIFRAGRCVVDTGMHHMRWSREDAIAYLTGLDGDAIGSTTREVDRYAAIPGQACSYKIGHTIWNQLRDRARRELGPRFDIRAFHDAGLSPGAMPLQVLDAVIADWSAEVKG